MVAYTPRLLATLPFEQSDNILMTVKIRPCMDRIPRHTWCQFLLNLVPDHKNIAWKGSTPIGSQYLT